jgi:hypothetical protein
LPCDQIINRLDPHQEQNLKATQGTKQVMKKLPLESDFAASEYFQRLQKWESENQ